MDINRLRSVRSHLWRSEIKVSDVRRYLNELRLVEVVSVSVDALSQLSVELLQRLHLSTVSFNHGSAQEVLMNAQETSR